MGADQGFGGLGGLGVEDLEREGGVAEGEGEGEDEALVPDGSGGSGVVGFGGLAAVRVDPEDDVGFEVAVPPIDVLEVLGGDDGDVEVVELGLLRAVGGGGGHGGGGLVLVGWDNVRRGDELECAGLCRVKKFGEIFNFV